MEPGERIGDWIVVSPLGKGGMGAVYLCHNAMSERLRAAVKVIDGAGPEDRERFLREVEAIDRIRHPNVVAVKGWGEDAGRLWIAMELVEGEDLRARLERGPLPADEAVVLVRQLAEALAHAHERGVTHRDVKPANIVLGGDGARLVDFGIARHEDLTRLTAEGLVAGTPAYLAPEAFTVAGPDPVALDVYALGQVLYEALTGTDAFPSAPGLSSGHQIARLVSLKNEAVALDPGSDFDQAVRTCIRGATAPSPAARIGSMTELLAVLDGEGSAPEGSTFFFDGAEAVDATPPPVPPISEPPAVAPPVVPAGPPPETPAPVGSSVSAGVVAAVVALVAAALGFGVSAGLMRSTPPPPAPSSSQPARLGKVKVERVMVDGRFDDGAVGEPLREHKRALARCYDDALHDDPGLTGALGLAFRVARDGKARDVEVTRDSLDSVQVSRCVVLALTMIPFSGRETPAEVTMGLRFVRR